MCLFITDYICNKNNVNSLSGRGFLAAVVSQSTGSSEEFQGMAVNNLSSTMMDKSFLENISSILRDFSDLSEENKIYLCQPQHLRFIVNLLLQENTTVVENASVILKNISKCLAVTESFRLVWQLFLADESMKQSYNVYCAFYRYWVKMGVMRNCFNFFSRQTWISWAIHAKYWSPCRKDVPAI